MPTRKNMQLARVFGIRIGVSASWFVVLFFLIYWLSDYYFPEVMRGSQTTAYVVAVAGALGYFASLILHELGHALVARRLGIPIVGIDLWFFGGLSHMRREPANAGEEFKIAAAGPAVTLALFLLCLVAIVLLAANGTVSDVALAREGVKTTPALALLGWLGFINAGAVRVQRRSPPSRSTAGASRVRRSGGAPVSATGPRRPPGAPVRCSRWCSRCSGCGRPPPAARSSA